MAELWELVDGKKNKTGVIHERGKEELIPEGMYHQVVEIWTKSASNKILLTKRHPDKKYGSLWECTGGSVIKGETSLEGAIRELREETGILVEKDKILYLGDTFYDSYVVDTYLCVLDEEEPILNLQPEEVVDAKFITFEEVELMKDCMMRRAWRHWLKFKDKIINW